jgi:hypothetical protein
MKKQEAEVLIQSAKSRLIKEFPQYTTRIEDTAVFLISSKNKLEKRNQIAAELGAPLKGKVYRTAGESLIGPEHAAVVMYYQSIQAEDFLHFLFHEFGHILSHYASMELFLEAKEDGDYGRDTPIRSGMAVWSEFIAEVIAYRTDDGLHYPTLWEAHARIESYMDEAVNSGYFEPYWFAFYCAMFFEDPIIVDYGINHQYAAIGADHCDDEVLPLIQSTLSVLFDQLDTEEYWAINRRALNKLGKCVNDLWDFCAKKRKRMLVSLADRLFQGSDEDGHN